MGGVERVDIHIEPSLYSLCTFQTQLFHIYALEGSQFLSMCKFDIFLQTAEENTEMAVV